jgi:hypothetical protein
LNCPCRPIELKSPITGFCHVVFQELLAIGLEVRDRRAAIGRVGPAEAKIQRLAAIADRQRLQAELSGAIFIVGERLRINHMQMNLTAGARRDLF